MYSISTTLSWLVAVFTGNLSSTGDLTNIIASEFETFSLNVCIASSEKSISSTTILFFSHLYRIP